MDIVAAVTGLTPLQKKVILYITLIALVFGAGFYTGIKTFNAKLTNQEIKYQAQIDKLMKDVADKDVEVQKHLAVRDEKTQEALIAKKQADDSGIKADQAEKKYRALEAQLNIPVTNDTTPPTANQVATACDEVIAKKDDQIKGLDAAYSNVFDAKTAADQAVQGLQEEKKDLVTSVDLSKKINSDLSKQLESQNRRKWLYLIGGALGGVATERALRK
jgi:hypothetical protein